MKPKLIKKCRDCGDPFEVYNTIQSRCVDCIIKKAQEDNQIKRDKRMKAYKTEQKEMRKQTREMKEAAMTLSKWLNRCQTYFNKYIRLRDKDQPCISCGTTGGVQWSAGHFYTVGGYGNLRFDEDNCHRQCWYNCNKNKHSNRAEYEIQLPIRIGVDRYIHLQSIRHQRRDYSIPEVKELIEHYKQLIKLLS